MADSNKSLLPPKKKDWCPGNYQIGIFIRTPQGTSLEAIWDNATPPTINKVLSVLPNKDTAKADMPSIMSRVKSKPKDFSGDVFASRVVIKVSK